MQRNLFVIVLLLFLTLISCKEGETPVAKQGRLDLTAWDFEEKGTIRLDGQWEFYWLEQLNPAEKISKRKKLDYVPVPSVWSRYKISDSDLPGEGYATYRLVVKVNGSKHLKLGLKFPHLGTAYKAYVNGRMVYKNGNAAINPSQFVPRHRPGIKLLNNDTDQLEIIIFIANYGHPNGGFWRSIRLGTENDILFFQERQFAMDWFLSGMLLLLGLYHLIQFLFQKEGKLFLFFGLFCLIVALRTSLTGEYCFYRLFPGISWQIGHKLAYLTVFVGFLCFIMAYYYLYPHQIPWKLAVFQMIVSAILAIVVLAGPPKVYTLFIVPYQCNMLLSIGYFIFIVIHQVFQKKADRVIILTGMLLFLAAIINDIFYNHLQIKTGSITPIGLLLYICSHSLVLSLRFARTFSENELLKSVDKAKDDFIANISHELKTPLSLIYSYSCDMQMGEYGKYIPAGHKAIDKIKKNGKHVLEQVELLLDMAKLDQGKIKLDLSPVEISTVITDAVEKVQHRFDLSSIKFTIHNPPVAQNQKVSIDTKYFPLVLDNILGNAVKFTEKGEIIIEYTYTETECILRIKDTGKGIAPEKLPFIFKRFYQVNEEGTEGTGIGLAFAKEITELHKGKISVKSREEKGTAFEITLPLSSEKNSPPREMQSIKRERVINKAEPILSLAVDKEKILLVEDSREMREYFFAKLSPWYQLITAGNGEEAFNTLAAHPDTRLVISDIIMPVMTGLDFLKRVNQDDRLKDIPFIFLTGKNDEVTRLEGLKLGAVDFISKPFSPGELMLKINNILEREHQIKQMYKKKLVDFLDTSQPPERSQRIDIFKKYKISKREQEVINLLLSDMIGKEIADELKISLNTVNRHCENIYKKCEIKTRIELINLFKT